MGRLSNLKLEEFSIVRGDGVQPANPGAVALFHKSTSKPKEKETAMSTTAALDPTKQSKASLIADAVRKVLKGTTVYESTSTYSSTSTSDVSAGEKRPQFRRF
jgi:hypothetical protein